MKSERNLLWVKYHFFYNAVLNQVRKNVARFLGRRS